MEFWRKRALLHAGILVLPAHFQRLLFALHAPMIVVELERLFIPQSHAVVDAPQA